MVSQVPIDPLDAIDLGVTSEMLEPLKPILEVFERILKLKNYRPCELARDCRSLEYLSPSKATEFRQILQLLLHCAVRLMAKGSERVDQAEVLVQEFVELYPSVYGSNSVTYNIHVLLHIPFYVRKYGPLDTFSRYKFENCIQGIKKCKKYFHYTWNLFKNQKKS